jgi:hypothetical protein
MMISTFSGSFGALVQNALVNKSVLDMTEVFMFGRLMHFFSICEVISSFLTA